MGENSRYQYYSHGHHTYYYNNHIGYVDSSDSHRGEQQQQQITLMLVSHQAKQYKRNKEYYLLAQPIEYMYNALTPLIFCLLFVLSLSYVESKLVPYSFTVSLITGFFSYYIHSMIY